jgi:hypothetical protein
MQRAPVIEEMPSTSELVHLASPITLTPIPPTQVSPIDPALDTISEETKYLVDPTKKQLMKRISEL